MAGDKPALRLGRWASCRHVTPLLVAVVGATAGVSDRLLGLLFPQGDVGLADLDRTGHVAGIRTATFGEDPSRGSSPGRRPGVATLLRAGGQPELTLLCHH